MSADHDPADQAPTPPPQPRKAGRPPLPIDAGVVSRLANHGLSMSEVAAVLGVSKSTIHDRFSAEFAMARANFRLSLRRAQYHRAVKAKSDKMLIHLGKCYLNQNYIKHIDASTHVDFDAVVDECERLAAERKADLDDAT